MALNERDCFTERPETRPMYLTCAMPRCRHRDTYQIKWVRRTKKDRPPGGTDERDRALFAKLRDHLFRIDDFATCTRCRRRFEIPSHQSMIFLDEINHGMTDVDEDA
jgi:hypothetical protein